MDEDAYVGIMFRALGYGASMGALIGGPLLALILAVAGHGSGYVMLFALWVTVLGAATGGLVGVVCAVLPGLLLATGRAGFSRHLWLARVCSSVASAFALDAICVFATYAHSGGGLPAPRVLGAAAILGSVVGMMGTGYIATGRKCLFARRVLRWQ